MATKPTGGRRGPPWKLLRNDPDRYSIAYFVALYDLGGRFGIGPYRLARHLMVARYGDFDSDEVRAAVAQGRPFKPPSKKHLGKCQPDATDWKDRDAFNALADGFLHKALRIEKKLSKVEPNGSDDAGEDAKDAAWLGLMVTVWRLALRAYVCEGDPLAAATNLAVKAGEREYFRRAILPYFLARIKSD